MSKDNPGHDPFKRSSKVRRSPLRQSEIELSRQGTAEESTQMSDSEVEIQPRKRKETSPMMPGSSRLKRMPGDEDRERDEPTSHGDDSENEALLEGADEFVQMTTLVQKVNQWFTRQYKSRKITPTQFNEMTGHMKAMSGLLTTLDKKVHRLEGRLDERNDIVHLLTNVQRDDPQPRVRSYADVSKTPMVPKITGTKRVVQQPKVVFIKSSDDRKNIDEVKKLVQETVKPKDLGIKVRKVIKTARGLMIETEKSEQLEKIKNCEALKTKGLIIEAPKKRSPKLMIYDLDTDRAEKEIIEDVYVQNIEEDLIPKEDFLKEFTCVHKYVNKNRQDQKANWVVECSARVRNLLRRRDRIYVGWQSCRLKDYNPIVRCYKCLAFGHISKYCKGKQPCSHCMLEHDIKECRNKAQPAKCINCKLAKKPYDHATGSKTCTEYERACRIALEKVDYGL